MIRIRHIQDLIGGREEMPEITAEAGRTIAELAPEGACICLTSLAPSNRCVRDDASWNVIRPPDGSILTYIETDGNSQQTIAIGLALVTAGLFTPLIGFAVGVIGVTMAITQNGTPVLPGGPSGKASSPTYGFGEPVNTIREGDSIQVAYGENLAGGQIIQQWREANNDFDQRINMLISLGEGPVHKIGQYDSATCIADGGTADGIDELEDEDIPERMVINGIDATELRDLKVSLRLGTATQTVCPGFEDVVREYTGCAGFRLGSKKSNAPYVWRTRGPVNEVRANIVFPNGIFKVDKEGNKVKLDEYPIVRMRVYEEDGTTVVKSKEFRFNKNKTSTLYATVGISNLELRNYVVKIQRTQRTPPAFTLDKPRGPYSDQMDMQAIHEVIYAPVAYRGLALVALSLKANDQISGGMPRVQTWFKGRLIDTGSGAAYTRNNADVAHDIATNRRYGGGNFFTPADIGTRFDAWRESCAELIAPWTGAPDTLAAVAAFANDGTDIAPVITGTYTGDDIPDSGTYTLELQSFVADTSAVIAWSFVSSDGEQTDSGTLNFTDNSPQPMHNGLSLAIDDPSVSTDDWEEGDTWTIEVLKEPRHRFDHVFDTPQPFFDALLLGVGPAGGAIINKLGRRLSATVEEPRLPRQSIGTWNIPQNGNIRWTGDAPINRFNRIVAEFSDRTMNYERAYTRQDTPRLKEGNDSLREHALRLTGVTRRTEAARHAARELRRQQRILVGGKLDGLPIETISFQPGDVVEIAEYRLEAAGMASGRTAGTSSGNVVLDRAVTFPANVVYRYIEYDSSDDTRRVKDFSYATETTTNVLSFAPLDAGDGVGSRYIIGPRGKVAKEVVVRTYTTGGDMMDSGLEFEEYVASVVTDDAEPQDPEIFAPVLAVAVNVTNLAVVETSNEDDESRLAVSWTAASGGVFYRIYSKIGEDDDGWGIEGQTSGTSFTFKSVARQGEPVMILVQTVTASGGRTPLETSPTITHTIRRVNGGQTLVLFPEIVTGAVITPGVGNNATLDWDAVTTDTNGDAMTVTGYEVRINEWNTGAVIHRGAARTLALKLPRTARTFIIRAYKTQAGERWYSPSTCVVTAAPAAHASYGTVAVAATHVDLSDAARLKNLNPIEWVGFFENEAALQIEDSQSVELISQAVDCGSAAPTQVSVDPWILTFMDEAGVPYYMTMEHIGTSGPINKNLIEWTLDVQSSNDGSSWSTYSSGGDSAGELLNSDIVINARYFRFRVKGAAVRFDVDDDADDRPGRVLIEQIAYALYRA